MAINLHEKYSDKIKQVYTHNSFVEGRTNQEYSFVGVKTVKIPNLITQDLNDYQRTGTNRYGTPNELQDAMQELSVTQDKSFAITIDKGNNVEQQMMKQAGRVMEAEMREKVTPTTDKYAFAQYAANAGHTIAYDAAVAKSNIISKLLDIEVYFEDNFVPTDRRYVFVKNTHIAAIKLAQEFEKSDSVIDKLIIHGIVGKIGTLNIVGVPAAYMPTNVEHIAFQSNSVMLPFKIKDSRIHQDPPGLSGHLLEGRFMYDAFVIGAICESLPARGAWIEMHGPALAAAPCAAIRNVPPTSAEKLHLFRVRRQPQRYIYPMRSSSNPRDTPPLMVLSISCLSRWSR